MSVAVASNAPNRVTVIDSSPNVSVINDGPSVIQVTSGSLPATKILSGNTAPTLSIGRVGDFYIQLITANLYGPKTSTSWGTPIQLGSIGPTGSSGVYVGPTPPIDTSLLWVDTSA